MCRQFIDRRKHTSFFRLRCRQVSAGLQAAGSLAPRTFQEVLAGIGRHPQNIGPLVFHRFKFLRLRQKFDKHTLANILGITGIF